MKALGILLLSVFFSFGIVTITSHADTFEVILDDTGLNPSSLMINKGDSVRWVNKGTSLHGVRTQGNFASGSLNPGVSFVHTFDQPGTIQYFVDDSKHSGSIFVGDWSITISPGNSTLHPSQKIDLFLFLKVDPSSRISLILDGTTVFDGDLQTLVTITNNSLLPTDPGAIKLTTTPISLLPGVHTVSAKVVTPTGHELTDSAVYTVALPVQGVLLSQ